MTANERYEIAIMRMRKQGIPIPHGVMRAALDETRGILRNRPGYHPTAITVVGNPTQEMVEMFGDIPSSVILRVSGQHWRGDI